MLALYGVRGWLLLINKEAESACPRCGMAMTMDKSVAVARLVRRCPHCETEADPLQASASGWIKSSLKPPE
ncbi:hypothetical protein [Nitrobacter winogradskyi]|uniref:hypothetical protein n=1 Tax=Nitrobacter winogradskyi TaxID=913 RepID=UPI001650BBE2|nr:hypothetical protein [Nitrobacter winogradskyi]